MNDLNEKQLDLVNGGVWAGPDGTGGCIPDPKKPFEPPRPQLPQTWL